MDLMINGLSNIDFKIIDEIITQFVLTFGEIEDRNSIKRFDELVQLIQKA